MRCLEQQDIRLEAIPFRGDRMDHTWPIILDGVPLSDSDFKLAQHFYKNKSQASYLGFAKLLKRYGFLHEATEVLNVGLKTFPNYDAIRVQLTHEFMHMGLVEEAFRTILPIAHKLRDNPMGLSALFQLAVLCLHEEWARRSFCQIQNTGLLKYKKIPGCESYQMFGIEQAKTAIINYWASQAINLILPEGKLEALRMQKSSSLDEMKAVVRNTKIFLIKKPAQTL